MNDYDKEKWFAFYTLALLELERALMTGRISDARMAIATRLDELRNSAEPHKREREVIEGALRTLSILEREEARLAEKDKQRILKDTIQELRKILPESNSSRTLPICPLCGTPCPLDDFVTDAKGHAVHRVCYRDALVSQRESL